MKKRLPCPFCQGRGCANCGKRALMLPRRRFLGLGAAIVVAPFVPTPAASPAPAMLIGVDLAAASDYSAVFFANAVRPWLTVTEARLREDLQLSPEYDLEFIDARPLDRVDVPKRR